MENLEKLQKYLEQEKKLEERSKKIFVPSEKDKILTNAFYK